MDLPYTLDEASSSNDIPFMERAASDYGMELYQIRQFVAVAETGSYVSLVMLAFAMMATIRHRATIPLDSSYSIGPKCFHIRS
jgi:hypothetical protein